jgi:hypothetical protein
MVQWTNPLLPVTRDLGSDPLGGYLSETGILLVSVVLLLRHECPPLAFYMGGLMISMADYKNKSSVTRPNLGLLNHIISRQCCGSGMFIPDPDFCPFRIPDPTKKGEEKKLFVEISSSLT